MSKKNSCVTKLSFFAAANGYSGFRSYFDEIFDPLGYTSLYILKGGPGTGKSSFMKQLLTEIEPLVEECEAIYCSSDSISLDGVIIKNGDQRVGIIDGTSPHSRDPIFPGAIDKIINLGDNWNEKMLSDNIDIITSLVREKTDSYKLAYDYLSIAGAITKKADESISRIYRNECNTFVKSLLDRADSRNVCKKVRLVTSFGKDGFCTLNTLGNIASEIYSVVGIYGSEYIFMREVSEALEKSGVDYTLFPSALDASKPDAIFIPSIGVAFTTERSSLFPDDHIIDTSQHLKQDDLFKQSERLEFLYREREAMLWMSVDQFKKASDAHFKLEKIYSSAMDFSKNDEAYHVCISEIKKKMSL